MLPFLGGSLCRARAAKYWAELRCGKMRSYRWSIDQQRRKMAATRGTRRYPPLYRRSSETMLPHLAELAASIEVVKRHTIRRCSAASHRSHGAGQGFRDRGSHLSESGSVTGLRAGHSGAHVSRDTAIAWTIDPALTGRIGFIHFIRRGKWRGEMECGIDRHLGGVDSAVTAYLAAEGPSDPSAVGVRMPYRTSSKESSRTLSRGSSSMRWAFRSRTIDIQRQRRRLSEQ